MYSGIKLKTPHLLRINTGNSKGKIGLKLHLKKDTNLPLFKGNNKKLISSNGQNYFNFGTNKNFINAKQEMPKIYNVPLHEQVDDDSKMKLDYKKINSLHRDNKNFSTNSNTMTKEDTLQGKFERSKSTIMTGNSNRSRSSKKLKRSNSVTRSAVKILDETIQNLSKLKTILLEEDEDLFDDNNSFSEDNSFSFAGPSVKRRNRQLKKKLQNGINNINELIKSSITGDVIDTRIVKPSKTLYNQTIESENKFLDKDKKKKGRIIINLEDHFRNKKKDNFHNRNKSFFLTGTQPKEKKSKHGMNKSMFKMKNYDSEVPIKLKDLKRNKSQIGMLKESNKKKSFNTSINKSKKKKINRYVNESGTDTLANFEFTD